MLKKTVLIFLFSGFLISLTGFALAQKPLEIIYPGVPGADAPSTTKTPLGSYIIYIFNLAVRVAGLIAFASLVYGGFRYLTSAGSPGAMSDANSQIKASFLGLIILLASYLILTTINPQLVKLRGSPIPTDRGVVLWTGAGGTGDRWATQQSIPDLAGFTATFLEFKTSSGDLDVIIYPETNYRGSGTKVDNSSSLGFAPGSIELVWEPPGVYLYKDTGCRGEYRRYHENNADLHSHGFGDNVKSLKIKNEGHIRMAAFLHEHRYMEGWCAGFTNEGCVSFPDNPGYEFVTGASSITVFQKDSGATGRVTLYSRTNFQESIITRVDGSETEGQRRWEREKICPTDNDCGSKIADRSDLAASLKIEGNFLVALFELDHGANPPGGRCSIFTESDLDLSDDSIGRCSSQCGLWIGPVCFFSINTPCVSAIEIFGMKR